MMCPLSHERLVLQQRRPVGDDVERLNRTSALQWFADQECLPIARRSVLVKLRRASDRRLEQHPRRAGLKSCAYSYVDSHQILLARQEKQLSAVSSPQWLHRAAVRNLSSPCKRGKGSDVDLGLAGHGRHVRDPFAVGRDTDRINHLRLVEYLARLAFCRGRCAFLRWGE